MSLMENSPATIIATETAVPVDQASNVDWAAIIAGAVVATGISVALLTFGSALGLTFASPFANTGWSAAGLTIALALWLVWVQVSSFFAGGYVAGRMRRRIHDATEHESDVRDGVHGLAVWGTGVLVGAVLLALGATGILGTATAAGGAATGPLAAIVGKNANSLTYLVTAALRSDQAAPADRAATSEAVAVLGSGISAGGVPEADRTYLAGLIGRQTGLSAKDASARADAMIQSAQQLADKARAAAERARKFGILAAFVAAASLAVSAAAAFWAAAMGGRHRDEGTVLSFFDRFR